jgi:amidase
VIEHPLPARIVIATDVWAAADDTVVDSLKPALGTLAEHVSRVEEMRLFENDAEWDALDRHSKALQGFEAWNTFGPWVRDNRHQLGSEIAERFDLASQVTRAEAERATVARTEFSKRLRGQLEGNTVLCMPTTPTVAARRDVPPAELQAVRLRTLRFTCLAGLAGVPQVNIPARTAVGAPCGLGFIGTAGQDESLLQLAAC